MSRPALVVGLGGTGQWVLTWLKRDLLLANDGKLPDNVRLLSIDTATQLEAGVRLVAGRQEEAVQVGNVSLEAGEFIYVGGDSRPLAQNVKNGRLSHIGKWYHAERWLEMLPPATFILDDGAGRIRQFGRIGVFKDVLGQETGSQIWRALRHALESVRSKVNDRLRLEILVVGSFAGGTGSGMFLDIALILRLLADQMGVHHVLRGFFALPTVFTPAPDDDMKARTFAAWRELNRFMVVNSDFAMPVVEYVQNAPQFRITPTQRIFDACYLIDSKRKSVPIASEAKLGVHPMVAEVVSAILDEHAGTDYTQYVFTNLATEYASTPDIPLYSALGSFTIQVPAHYKQEISTLDFTQDILQALLVAQDDSWPSTGAERHLILAAPDQNQERGQGFPGRAHSRELLGAEAVSYLGETAKPTPFTGRIADIIETARDKNQRANLINQLARAGGRRAQRGGRSASWVPFFTNLGDDPQFEQVRRNVRAEASYDFVRGYQRREGQSAQEVRGNFRRIPTDMRQRYGGLMATGVESFGSFGDRLQEAQAFHLVLFRNLVRLRLLDMLMGRSEQDPIKSKGGKIGYAWDYFDGLVNEFEIFLTLMDEVKKVREEIKPGIKLQEQLQNARRFMEQKANANILGFERPVVKSSENQFLQAQQRVADQRKEEILHHFVVQTAREMREICIKTRDTIQRWIWHLSTGDDPSKINGLVSNLKAVRKSIGDDHTFDTSVPKVQRLVGEDVRAIPKEDVAAALRQWEWLARFEGNHLILQAQINPEASDEQPAILSDPTLQITTELRQEIARRNQRNLLGLGRRRFSGTAARTTVAEEIKKLFPTIDQFVGEVAPGAEPLFEGSVGANPRRKSNLIRVMASENDPYFHGENGLEGQLRLRQNLNPAQSSDNYNIRVVNSDNPYKLTLVRTDDLYPHDAFKAWHDCQAAYARHLNDEGRLQDPVLMHNFSAEGQAVRYEREFVRDGEAYRPLHPRLVMLLENPHALRQFFYFGMLGMVNQVQNERLHRWQLTWEKNHREQVFWLTRGWDPQRDRGARASQPDIMNAIHGYAIRRQTWQPGRNDQIDYEFADRLIRSRLESMGADEERKMLQYHLDSGFIAWLRKKAYDPSVPDRVVHQDFADLTKVAGKIFQERLNELRPTKSRVVDSPWKRNNKPKSSQSRIETLLKDEKMVQQFLYLGMLGMVRPQQDNHGYRWQLTLSKSTGEDAYWLTPSWDSLHNRNQPKPDFMDALEGYIMVRKSQRPRHETPIDYQLAAQLIQQRQDEMGSRGEVDLLQNQLNRGFIVWLTKQAYDPDVPGRVVRQDFAELASKAKQMLVERIEELTRPVETQVHDDPFALAGGGGGGGGFGGGYGTPAPSPASQPFSTDNSSAHEQAAPGGGWSSYPNS